jgi:hypothetical protein
VPKQSASKTDLPTRTHRWICKLDFFDPDYNAQCPRCGKGCQWLCSITIWPSGPIHSGTIHSPICPCPDDHIREAIASALAGALLKEYRKGQTDAERPG